MGSIFALVLLVELAALAVFAVILYRGVTDPVHHHWLGTLPSILPVVGLTYLLPRQLGFMYSELAGHYIIEISDDQIAIRPKRFQIGSPRPVRRGGQTYAFVGRFLPLMEIVVVQDEGRFVFGSTLSTVERRRVVQQIVACLDTRTASSATL